MADVAVYDKDGRHLMTYPISLGGMNYRPQPDEAIKLAMKAAEEDRLVPAGQDVRDLTFVILPQGHAAGATLRGSDLAHLLDADDHWTFPLRAGNAARSLRGAIAMVEHGLSENQQSGPLISRYVKITDTRVIDELRDIVRGG